jgi:hypothetical protein
MLQIVTENLRNDSRRFQAGKFVIAAYITCQNKIVISIGVKITIREKPDPKDRNVKHNAW